MVKVRIIASVFMCTLTPYAFAQTSRIAPWSDGDLTATGRSVIAYHPEPIIFVHGTSSNRLRWTNVLSYVQSSGWFTNYHYVSADFIAAKESTAAPAEDYVFSEITSAGEAYQWQDIEKPYVHTWNYGRHAKRGPLPDLHVTGRPKINRQSNDPIGWNSWGTNSWGLLSGDYLQSRVTLRERIDQIRLRYTVGPNQPNVLLIGHSQGGLLIADYLMTKNANLGSDPYVPVRRAVTVDSLLWGSPLGNLLVNWQNVFWNPFIGVFKAGIRTVAGVTSPSFSTWLQNPNGATRYFTMDLQSGVTNLDIPALLFSYELAASAPFSEKARAMDMPTTTEFVTSVAKRPDLNPALDAGQQILLAPTLVDSVLKKAVYGDGLVPLNSQAGYHSNGVSAFRNVNPVDIRGYLYTGQVAYATNWISVHGPAIDKLGIYPHLFDGVQYVTGPRPERPGGWSGLQKQYTNSPIQSASGSTFTHTDEPGIADLRLLHTHTSNPLLVSSFDTWGTNSNGRAKTRTNATDFVNCQIITSTGSATLSYFGTVGTKNHSQNPMVVSGTNYWAGDGNEYLPASLAIRCDAGNHTNAWFTNSLTSANQIVSNCLVQLDSDGAPLFQYGLFTNSATLNGTNHYFIAAQGQNLAGLLTPQNERAFDVPVDSAPVVGILRKINQGEALSNACELPLPITRWTNTVSEWVNIGNNGTFTLNFFPVSSATPNIRDAWTNVAASGISSYSATTKTVTVDTNAAPSQVIVSNLVYLGCDQMFTNSYNGQVPALGNDTLAGVPVDAAWLGYVRERMANVLVKYRNTATNICLAWTLPAILEAAHPGTNSWLPIASGLLAPQHFTELKAVADLLTDPATCCCAMVTITLTPSSPGTNALPNGYTNTVYATTISASGGTTRYDIVLVSGSLPPGLTLTNVTDHSASITGTPTTIGSNVFVISATDTNGCTTNQTYSLVVSELPPAPTSCPCTNWPPSSWPCGGLTESYTIKAGSWFHWDVYWESGCTGTNLSWQHIEVLADVTVTADGIASCLWNNWGSANANTRVTTSYGTDWSGWGFYQVALYPAGWWQVQVSARESDYGPSYSDDAYKQTGLTPAGNYPIGLPGDCLYGTRYTASVTVQ